MSAWERLFGLRSLDECCSNARVIAKFAANRRGVSYFRRGERQPGRWRIDEPALQRPPKAVDRVQSACKMQYDPGGWVIETLDAREEAMPWLPPKTR
jgi:hypothetical protein